MEESFTQLYCAMQVEINQCMQQPLPEKERAEMFLDYQGLREKT